MPIFEYRCRDCQHRFETLIRGTQSPECPACRSADLEKQLSVFAVTSGRPAPAMTAGPCGTCGDPRGPGSCSLN